MVLIKSAMSGQGEVSSVVNSTSVGTDNNLTVQLQSCESHRNKLIVELAEARRVID